MPRRLTDPDDIGRALREIRAASLDDLPTMRDDYVMMHPGGIDQRIIAEIDGRLAGIGVGENG